MTARTGGAAAGRADHGSDSDWRVMSAAGELLDEFGVAYEVGVVSAHRTPQRMLDYAAAAAGRGLRVIIAGAGGAAHCPGMVAVGDGAAGDRRAGAAGHPGRDGLAAVDRADAGRDPGGLRVDRRCAATPACSRCGSWPRPRIDADLAARLRCIRRRPAGDRAGQARRVAGTQRALSRTCQDRHRFRPDG